MSPFFIYWKPPTAPNSRGPSYNQDSRHFHQHPVLPSRSYPSPQSQVFEQEVWFPSMASSPSLAHSYMLFQTLSETSVLLSRASCSFLCAARSLPVPTYCISHIRRGQPFPTLCKVVDLPSQGVVSWERDPTVSPDEAIRDIGESGVIHVRLNPQRACVSLLMLVL